MGAWNIIIRFIEAIRVLLIRALSSTRRFCGSLALADHATGFNAPIYRPTRSNARRANPIGWPTMGVRLPRSTCVRLASDNAKTCGSLPQAASSTSPTSSASQVSALVIGPSRPPPSRFPPRGLRRVTAQILRSLWNGFSNQRIAETMFTHIARCHCQRTSSHSALPTD